VSVSSWKKSLEAPPPSPQPPNMYTRACASLRQNVTTMMTIMIMVIQKNMSGNGG